MARSVMAVGRPIEHDPEQVVDAAMAVFWQQGFEATSLPDLERATGVQRSTLYNSFGGKTGLYERAATRYVDILVVAILAPLHGEAAGRAALVDFLDVFESVTLADQWPPGCLIVNSFDAPSCFLPQVERYLAELRGGLARSLRAAGVGDPERATSAVLAAVIGVNAAARHDLDLAAELLGGLRRLVEDLTA